LPAGWPSLHPRGDLIYITCPSFYALHMAIQFSKIYISLITSRHQSLSLTIINASQFSISIFLTRPQSFLNYALLPRFWKKKEIVELVRKQPITIYCSILSKIWSKKAHGSFIPHQPVTTFNPVWLQPEFQQLSELTKPTYYQWIYGSFISENYKKRNVLWF
jgi:hypothetical protein